MDSILFCGYFFSFVFGLCIGSFLNCVIYRLEQKKPLSGRSFCPKCKKQLKWHDLIPVLSFVFLRGKCRLCKKEISLQYPLVELATGLVFALIFGFVGYANPVQMLFLFYVFSCLIIIFVYDLKHYLIPDVVLLPLIVAAAIYDFLVPCSMFYIPCLKDYLLGAAIGFGFFYFFYKISNGKWMGFGDAKLAILMGLLLGVSKILAALFFAFFFGAIIGIISIALQKKKLKSEIPLGPFLVLGTVIAQFWGDKIINWYLNLM